MTTLTRTHNRVRPTVGIIALLGFLASIPFANWWLDTHGFWNSPLLGPLPSALWVVAISFVLRDLAQITLGRRWAWAAIAVGVALTYWISPAFAVASAAAFAISESTDALIFTPLADRGRFLLGVTISGYAAGFVDSAVFLRLAFGSWDGWWQLGIAKAVVVLAATPVAWLVRKAIAQPKEQVQMTDIANASGDGFFQKYVVNRRDGKPLTGPTFTYVVNRRDGKPLTGPTFTIELYRDPVGVAAIRLYAQMTDNADLAGALNEMLGSGHPLDAEARAAAGRLAG